jgi:tripartite-type tricarboxylate transporter receptor subunit TctC
LPILARSRAAASHSSSFEGANFSTSASRATCASDLLVGWGALAAARPDGYMLGYLNVPSMYAGYLNQVWSVTRGIVGPAGLPKDVETKLVAALEQVLNSKDHQQKAEQLSLEPKVIKGEDYRKILKANEQDTKKLMGW